MSSESSALEALERIESDVRHWVQEDAAQMGALADISTIGAALRSTRPAEGAQEPVAYLVEFENEPGDWRYFGCRKTRGFDTTAGLDKTPLRYVPLYRAAPEARPAEHGLESVARKLVAWVEKYPSGRVYSHHAIQGIAKEIDAIAAEARAALARPAEHAEGAAGTVQDRSKSRTEGEGSGRKSLTSAGQPDSDHDPAASVEHADGWRPPNLSEMLAHVEAHVAKTYGQWEPDRLRAMVASMRGVFNDPDYAVAVMRRATPDEEEALGA